MTTRFSQFVLFTKKNTIQCLFQNLLKSIKKTNPLPAQLIDDLRAVLEGKEIAISCKEVETIILMVRQPEKFDPYLTDEEKNIFSLQAKQILSDFLEKENQNKSLASSSSATPYSAL